MITVNETPSPSGTGKVRPFVGSITAFGEAGKLRDASAQNKTCENPIVTIGHTPKLLPEMRISKDPSLGDTILRLAVTGESEKVPGNGCPNAVICKPACVKIGAA